MISVVIPLYNKELHIKETLLSVLNQSYQNFEVLVVDDGSTDNSYQEVIKIKDKRIRIIKKENGGESSARNRGIEEAKYEYIAFLDADDIWKKNYLFIISKLIVKFPSCGVYSTNYAFSQNNKIKNAFNSKYFREKKIVDNYFIRSIDKPLITSNTAVIKKRIFHDVGYFNENLRIGPDLDMWFRIMLKYKLAFDPFIGAIYNLDAQGRVMNEHRDPNVSFIKSLLSNKQDKKSVFVLYYIKEIAIRELIYIAKNHNNTIFKKTLSEFIKLGVINQRWLLFSLLPCKNISMRAANKIFLIKVKIHNAINL